MASFLQLIPKLHEAGVEFIVVGGVAAAFHGSARHTVDLDILAPMALENLQRLILALADCRPKFFTRPDLPVVTPDNHNLRGIKNLYLMTDLGRLDVLGILEGFGDYHAMLTHAVEADLGASIGRCKVLDLDTLIAVKRSVGRQKDRATALELEQIRAIRAEQPPQQDEIQ